MRITVSEGAAALVRRCGGDLYIWSGQRPGSLACSAGAAPPDVEFRRHVRQGLDLFVEAGLRVQGAGIEVTLGRFPRTHLRAASAGLRGA